MLEVVNGVEKLGLFPPLQRRRSWKCSWHGRRRSEPRRVLLSVGPLAGQREAKGQMDAVETKETCRLGLTPCVASLPWGYVCGTVKSQTHTLYFVGLVRSTGTLRLHLGPNRLDNGKGPGRTCSNDGIRCPVTCKDEDIHRQDGPLEKRHCGLFVGDLVAIHNHSVTCTHLLPPLSFAIPSGTTNILRLHLPVFTISNHFCQISPKVGQPDDSCATTARIIDVRLDESLLGRQHCSDSSARGASLSMYLQYGRVNGTSISNLGPRHARPIVA